MNGERETFLPRRAWRSGGIDINHLMHTGQVRRAGDGELSIRAEAAPARTSAEVIEDMSAMVTIQAMTEEGVAA